MRAQRVWRLAMMGLVVTLRCSSVWAQEGADNPAPTTEGSSPARGNDGDAEALEAVVARVQKAYQKLETFSGKFTQTVTITGMSRTRTDSGTVMMKRGGKMRWDFQSPDVKHFVSDGKTMWFYFPAEHQVMSLPLEQSASQVALDFMFGLGDVRKDFDVSLARGSSYGEPALRGLHLVPKKPMGTLKRLTILVGEDGMVKEAIVEDQMGTVTRVRFSDVAVNQPIPDERFAFKPPEGVTETRATAE